MTMRIKKGQIEITQRVYIHDAVLISCPYCKTKFGGHLSNDIIRIKCYKCKRVVEIDWQSAKKYRPSITEVKTALQEIGIKIKEADQ